MSIVNMKQILKEAQRGCYAILHANVINYDMAKTVLFTADETHSPIIVAVSEKALRGFTGTSDFVNIVRLIVKENNVKVPVVIHLDHGEYKTVLSAIKSGFTSVMYDGSRLPLRENLKNTKTIVTLAHKKNISVECEVGTVLGKVEDRVTNGQLATVQECKQMANTGIDALAAGIGNLHGKYPKD
jgi:fructose-bisphosphate aldolase class II